MLGEVKELLETQNRDLQGFIKVANTQLTDMKSSITEGDEKLHSRMDQLEARWGKPSGADGLKGDGESLGSRLVKSNAFSDFRDRGGVGKMRFKVDSSILPETKTLTTSVLGDTAVTTGAGVVGIPRRRLRVRSLVPSRRVTQGSAQQYLRQLASTGGASPQVEASLKAQTELNFDLATATYRTIAVWTAASRQVLDDEQEMQAVIDRELMYLLESEVESQLLAGDGTGQNLNGLIPQSTAYQAARSQSNDTHIDKLSHGLTQLEEADFEPSFIVVHPRDREIMRLIKTEEGGANKGQYVYGDPATRDSASVWSTPVAVTKSIAKGTFLIGDATRGALILDRMESVIDISEHHNDYFGRNLVAIRAECRLALIVFREDALVYGSF